MTFSFKRVNAILQKDYKDFSRNFAVSIVIIIPPITAAIYGRMGIESIDSFYMLINMAFSMVAAFVQCCLIAEEKEKNTLRGLMLSPASTSEILTGKSLLSFILTIGVIIFTVILAEYRPQNIGLVTIAIILSSFFYIGLGTLLGLFSKSVMEASVIVLPVIIIFSIGSFITGLASQYPILKLANYLPNIQLIELAKQVEIGAGFGDVMPNLGIILVWVMLIVVLTTITYRKRMVN
ncbi:ABC transporter permease [Bacillus sp. FJAT-49711]|uniref:ABC transporter permease n=1 Tax=Bacillus sp. FJAT-49711 TaxID=2833585 RepID=UPI001BC8DCC4|nr:ABC transporter permease [Bacillus sp. FJAT-49711]MBS4220682.1 ABC transporter permease [Bacillus sp. FJAT-49711]